VQASPDELRILAPHSFELSPEVIKTFESQHDVKLTIIKAGSSGEMIHKILLTQRSPIADVIYGINRSSHYPKIKHLLSTYKDIAYGTVALNIDREWFKQHQYTPPKSLEELIDPKYKNLIAFPSPTTSSTSQSFLMANIQYWGEEKTMTWWNKMRENGLKLTKSWSDMYYHDFSAHGGQRPIVLSYQSSPAAELFYSKNPKKNMPRTESLNIPGGTWVDIEGAGILARSKKQNLARIWLSWLNSETVQQDIQTRMWMIPLHTNTPLHEVYNQVGLTHTTPKISSFKWQDQWLSKWKKEVYRHFVL
jgi:thiamine transport system substrate-binding protein